MQPQTCIRLQCACVFSETGLCVSSLQHADGYESVCASPLATQAEEQRDDASIFRTPPSITLLIRSAYTVRKSLCKWL